MSAMECDPKEIENYTSSTMLIHCTELNASGRETQYIVSWLDERRLTVILDIGPDVTVFFKDIDALQRFVAPLQKFLSEKK